MQLNAGRCRAARSAGPAAGAPALQLDEAPVKALPGRSLNSKLVLTSVLLLVVMLAALAANSMRLMEDALIEQARLRARTHRTHAQRGAGRAARRRRLGHAAEHPAREPRRGWPELPGSDGQPGPFGRLRGMGCCEALAADRGDHVAWLVPVRRALRHRTADHDGRSTPRRAALRHIDRRSWSRLAPACCTAA